HSEGSLIGMIASEDNPNVSKYISVAGSGAPLDELLKKQLSRNLEGVPDMKNMAFSYIDELKQGRTIENVLPVLYSLFRPSVQPFVISLFRFNPQEEIKKLSIPILILQGTLDIQVSENEAELLYKANPNAQKVIIQNMDHVLKTSKSADANEQMANSYYNPNTPINKELVEKIVEFIIPNQSPF
ncbi:MAG: alpha/beta hydrolase, partial [Bacteroidales bacterium]|nr:alpha/beta hydrolase [Bacteroidales bacterium]